MGRRDGDDGEGILENAMALDVSMGESVDES